MRQMLVTLALAMGIAAAAEAADASRPNIVVIMADDMGYSDLGCYGSEIDTPNLDGLAAGGMRFTQFYNTARCCPTRASLLTGLYPHQAGVGHMVNDRGLPAYQGYLNDRCLTLAEVLGPAGYVTLMSGKWHVGEERPHWPCDRGFDRYFGLISGASNYFRLDPERKMARDNEPYTPPDEGFYMTDAIAERAAAFVEEHAEGDRPFLLYVAFTAPHWPLHAPPAEIEKYRGTYMDGWDALRARRLRRMVGMGLIKPEWGMTPRDAQVPAWEEVAEADRAAWDLKMAVYAAQVDRLDQGIGRILDRIRARGIEHRTLVLFLADNGGCAEQIDRGEPGVPPGPKESFLSYGRPWANASNTPFRLYKHWVHEGGIASPLIASWPGVIAPGQMTDQVAHLIDIMATCRDLAGAEYPAARDGQPLVPLEGRSLAPLFRGGAAAGTVVRTLYWEHEGNRAVRSGAWKLVSRHGGEWELYDLDADRTELHDLAGLFPERVEELARAYDAWAGRCGVVPWAELPKPAAAAARRDR